MDALKNISYTTFDNISLRPLPERRYETGVWREAKANIDYHVQVDWHCYSVPHNFTNQPVEVRLSTRTVEIFNRGRRVALHARSHQRGGCTTDPAHRPKAHQRHMEWTPGRLVQWSGKDVGPCCAQAVTKILADKPHPEQGYRACLGIMRLGRQYGTTRLEAACLRAVRMDACNYRSIKSILTTAYDRLPLPPDDTQHETPIRHENIRGQAYYSPAKTVHDEAMAATTNDVGI